MKVVKWGIVMEQISLILVQTKNLGFLFNEYDLEYDSVTFDDS